MEDEQYESSVASKPNVKGYRNVGDYRSVTQTLQVEVEVWPPVVERNDRVLEKDE